MKPATLGTLNMRELDRLKMIQAVVDMGLKPGRAAERLGLTVRQVERLLARYRESGAAGLASRKRGTPGNRKLDEGLALRVPARRFACQPQAGARVRRGCRVSRWRDRGPGQRCRAAVPAIRPHHAHR